MTERMSAKEYLKLSGQTVQHSNPRRQIKTHPLNKFLLGLKALGFPEPQLEYHFHAERKWRFDVAWNWDCGTFKPKRFIKIAIEYNGIFGNAQHGHSSVAGLMRDYEKLNEAILLGWIVIQITAESIESGKAFEWVRRAFEIRGLHV